MLTCFDYYRYNLDASDRLNAYIVVKQVKVNFAALIYLFIYLFIYTFCLLVICQMPCMAGM